MKAKSADEDQPEMVGSKVRQVSISNAITVISYFFGNFPGN